MNDQTQNLTENTPSGMALRLVGGWLCLDFANTVGERNLDTGTLRNEHLNTFDDLVVWGGYTDILTDEQVQHLLDEAARRPTEAEAALHHAKSLRDAIFDIFSAPLYDNPIPAPSLEILNTNLSEVMIHSRLIEEHEGHFVWGWQEDKTALDRVLWDVVRSAADLLT